MVIAKQVLERIAAETHVSRRVGDGLVELGLDSVVCDESSLRGVLRGVHFDSSGGVVDVGEQAMHLGPLSLLPDLGSWRPEFDAAFEAVRRCLNANIGEEFRWRPFSLWPDVSLCELLALYLSDGPPSALPRRFSDGGKIAQRLSERLSVEKPRGGDVCASMHIGCHAIDVARATFDGLGGDLWLRGPDGRRHHILYHPAEGDAGGTVQLEPFDGDTVTMRSVLDVLSHALTLAGLDTIIELCPPDEEEWSEALFDEAVLLSRLLRYNGKVESLDWRIEGDSVGTDGVRNGHLTSARRASPAAALAFDEFVREHFDSSFTSQEAQDPTA